MKLLSRNLLKSFLSLITILAAHSAIAGTHFNKVIYVVFENTNYSAADKQADFNRIKKYGAHFTKMMAEGHPSQGNYIAMIAGSMLGVTNDKNVDLKESHLGDLLEKANLKWRVYAEDYPGNCYTKATYNDYARKHVPFMSFINVSKNPTRCGSIESEKRFTQDLESGTLPEFTMYIPNQKNDGHDTGVDFAGKWMAKTFEPYFSRPEILKDTLFIITFDESGASLQNKIYTVLIGGGIKPGSSTAETHNHLSLLKMIEDEFKLGNLGREDVSAKTITGIWKN